MGKTGKVLMEQNDLLRREKSALESDNRFMRMQVQGLEMTERELRRIVEEMQQEFDRWRAQVRLECVRLAPHLDAEAWEKMYKFVVGESDEEAAQAPQEEDNGQA